MLSEDELLRLVAGVERRELRTWVASGWVRPAPRGGGGAYTEMDCARVQLIRELRHELRVEEDTVPLVLSLMDQVYGLRRELRRLAASIGCGARAASGIEARRRRRYSSGCQVQGSPGAAGGSKRTGTPLA